MNLGNSWKLRILIYSIGVLCLSIPSEAQVQVNTNGTYLKPCTNGQVITYNTTTNKWDTCASNGTATVIGDTQVAYATSANTIGGDAIFRFANGTNEGQLKLGELYAGTYFSNYHVAASSAVLVGPNDTNHDYGGQLILQGDTTAEYPRLISLFSNGTISDAPTRTDAGNFLFALEWFGYLDDGFGTTTMLRAGSLKAIAADDFDGNQTSAVYLSLETSNNSEALQLRDIGLVLINGGSVQSDTEDSHTARLRAYDVDGTAYKTFATLTNGNTPDFTIAPPSGGTISLAGRLIASTGTPAVTNTTANSCGTSAASLVGNDNAFKVTVGATAGTSCTVTFATTFANAPSCTVTNETTANLLRATSTASTVILAGTMVAGDVLAGSCIGR